MISYNESVKQVLSCAKTINNTILNKMFILLYNVFKTLQQNCKFDSPGLTLHAFVGVHLCTCIVLHGYLSLSKTSGQITKAAGSDILL